MLFISSYYIIQIYYFFKISPAFPLQSTMLGLCFSSALLSFVHCCMVCEKSKYGIYS